MSTTVDPDLYTNKADPVPAEPDKIVFPTTCNEADGVEVLIPILPSPATKVRTLLANDLQA